MTQRIAVVTGGIGGIGTAICEALANSGCIVIAADLGTRAERVSAFRSEVEAYGDRIRFANVDVSNAESCAALVQHIEAEIGPVAILVNSAGITRDMSLRKMTQQHWMEVINVNLGGVFNMCRQVVDGMCERGFGRVVNISSINGQTGQFGQTNYSASKAGVHGFTMAMAREVARKGVTVNSISPGYCRTTLVAAIPETIRNQIIAQIPVGRIGEPKEIARAVTFLTANDAGYITGVNLPINGGLFISF